MRSQGKAALITGAGRTGNGRLFPREWAAEKEER